jgi:DNA-directed RNA polymerase subunit RPC12/RpoP
MWMRSCAICKALLHKLQLRESVRCQCGWVW